MLCYACRFYLRPAIHLPIISENQFPRRKCEMFASPPRTHCFCHAGQTLLIKPVRRLKFAEAPEGAPDHSLEEVA